MQQQMGGAAAKPRLRGRLHQIAFFCAVPAGIALVVLGRTPRVRTSVAVYALGLVCLYGVSAAYHRLEWSPGARLWMRKLDHSTIFVFIAATYTPFSMLGLHGVWRTSILATVWSVAALGIALKLMRLRATSGAATAMYVALGWTAVIALPQLVRQLSAPAVALLIVGGILYTIGAIIYALKRPDPNPAVFGYHEVYHSLVIGGSLCHYLVVLSLVVSA